MKTRILRELKNAGDYVSGQYLCEKLGVSRTAVWKCINQLKEDGYVIEAVPNKGYCLTSTADLITKCEIESRLGDKDIVNNVVYFDQTDSTNNEAKAGAEKGAVDGALYITECQTGGRGRRGKTWISPAGSGIWMSLVLRPKMSPQYASMLTILSAMAVVDGIKSAVKKATGTEVDCQIKWPNDIVVNKKKVCGILTELSAEMDQINYVVIGIGINVNTTDFEESIRSMASSLFLETGEHVMRSDVILGFSKAFSRYYHIFMKTKDLSGIMNVYNKMLANRDQQVRIIDSSDSFEGVALGINERGELIVKKEDGTEQLIVAGEVSVRGLYGYV